MRQSNVLLVQDLESSMELLEINPLFFGVFFQAFVYVNLHVCLCAPHKPLHLAMKQCRIVLLLYLMLFSVVTSRIESLSLRVGFFY